MARRTARWFLSLQTTLFLLLIFVRGNEDAEDAYKNGRNLVLEYFLPINLPAAVDPPLRREKRDVEGSGEEETVFSEVTGGRKSGGEEEEEAADNSTQNALAKLLQEEQQQESVVTVKGDEEDNAEGSGEVDESSSESSEMSSEEKSDGTGVPIIGGGEVLTTTESEEVGTQDDRSDVESDMLTSTEMIFDKSEDFQEISTTESEETTTETVAIAVNTTETAAEVPTEVPAILINTTTTDRETTTVENSPEETTTEVLESKETEVTTPAVEESTTGKPQTTIIVEETTTVPPTESVTIIPHIQTEDDDTQTTKIPTTETTTKLPTVETTTTPVVTTTTTTEAPTVIPVVIPHVNVPEEPGFVDAVANISTTTTTTTSTTTTTTTVRPVEETTRPSTAVPPTVTVPKATGTPSVPASPPATPVVEDVFEETKIGKKLEALPGNILQKENLSLAADPLLIVNTRLMDSEENVQLSSSEPKRLGAYIVIGLILLSFSSLVGYITFRKRMNRKRQEFESNQESHDTEKALLSLTDYKDNSELEENHLKNNEITPIVVKSNSQINKFEKNTNFSSPKNLNTIANEKNIEKDNVLKSTAENLTQVIIEDSPKDVEEEKNVPNLEKLIVKTRIDQDSIPKKPIIINRSSAGYLPIPQDNS